MSLSPRARRKVLTAFLAGFFISTAACKKSQPSPPPDGAAARPAAQRVAAPNFTLKDLAGNTVSLSQFKGKVVLIDFWATWCGPCRMSMPSVEKLHRDYAGKDFQVLGLNVDETSDGVAEFVKKVGASYPVLLVGTSGVDTQYGVTGIPAFLLLDKEGRAADNWVGFDSSLEGEWRRSIDALLKE